MRPGNSASSWWYSESPQVVFIDGTLSVAAYLFEDNWVVVSRIFYYVGLRGTEVTYESHGAIIGVCLDVGHRKISLKDTS